MVNSEKRMLQMVLQVGRRTGLDQGVSNKCYSVVKWRPAIPTAAIGSIKVLAFLAVTLYGVRSTWSVDRTSLSTSKSTTTAVANPGTVVQNSPPALVPISFNATTGVVTLTGDNGVNVATVQIDTLNSSNPSDDQVVASIVVAGQSYVQRFARAAVREVYFFGYDGNDSFGNMTSILSRADGGNGNDSLFGGQGQDFLYGSGGNDYIYAGYGNDVVYGGIGNDTIVGGDGSDDLYGESGNDTITDYAFNFGESNIIDGGSGNDLIYGYGDASFVEISGGAGHDLIFAFGIATVYGNSGDDVIYGSSGKDIIYGQDGNDDVYAGDGNDLVYGGNGNDWLYGGRGNDSLFGQDGSDYLYGEEGNDFAYGGNDDDSIDGGANDDGLFGGDGADLLLGQSGSDFLSGGYVRYDLKTGAINFSDVSDWNSDDLVGGSGKDQMVIADKKFFGVWLDSVHDQTSEDLVYEQGWLSFIGQFAYPKWGHLLGS